MRKNAVKTIGIFFLIAGFLHIFSFLRTGTQPKYIISLSIAGFDAFSFLYLILILYAGYNILKFNSSGRTWGIIALIPFLLVLSLITIFMPFYIIISHLTNMVTEPLLFRFPGTPFGFDRDYTITNPWIVLVVILSYTIILWLLTIFLSLKDTKELFKDRKEVQQTK